MPDGLCRYIAYIFMQFCESQQRIFVSRIVCFNFLQVPIILLHLVGGLMGYAFPRMTGFSEVASRTMAIETSMKSSAFGFLLAKLHFGEYAARVPSAVSVVWMALTGSILAVIWRFIPVKDE